MSDRRINWYKFIPRILVLLPSFRLGKWQSVSFILPVEVEKNLVVLHLKSVLCFHYLFIMTNPDTIYVFAFAEFDMFQNGD